MSVLYVVLAREYSGAETAYEPVLRADEDPLLACPPGSATEAWAHRLGVATVPIGFREVRTSGGVLETARGGGRALLVAGELRRLLRMHPERTVVVGTSMRPSALASVAALGLGRRVVWTITDLVRPAPLGAALRRLAGATGARVIAHSRYVAERAAPPGVVVSHPGVGVRPDAGGERDASLVLTVGHVSPTKRTDLAVDVAQRAARDVPSLRLEIVGRAQYRAEDHALERALAARVAGDSHLTLVGHDPDVRARMRRAAVLLHCRPDEPFGMVLVEAMAAGLPVVAPASAGPLEIVADGETGLLYPPGDVEAAAAALTRLLRDPALARRMGEAGRARVRERFTAERYAAEVLAVLSHGAPALAARPG